MYACSCYTSSGRSGVASQAQLTTLIEYLTVLLEYIDFYNSVQILGRPGPYQPRPSQLCIFAVQITTKLMSILIQDASKFKEMGLHAAKYASLSSCHMQQSVGSRSNLWQGHAANFYPLAILISHQMSSYSIQLQLQELIFLSFLLLCAGK